MYKKGTDILFSQEVQDRIGVREQGVIQAVEQGPYAPLYMCKGWDKHESGFEISPIYVGEKDIMKNHHVQPVLEDALEDIKELNAASRAGLTAKHPSSQKFHDLCDEIKTLHDKKQADYGRTNDPFANIRSSVDFGMPGWVGCMVRANDKMRRIQAVAQGSKLQNEGVEDSFMDLATYALIGLVLYQEEGKQWVED